MNRIVHPDDRLPAHRSGEVSLRSLEPAQRRLLALMQRLRFGRISCLDVRDGLPVLSGLVATRTIKVLGINSPHGAASAEDYVLRREARVFLDMLAELRDATVNNLEVHDGLPVSFEIYQPVED